MNNDRDYCRTGITLVCVANETNGERALISAVHDIARVACDLLDLTKEGDKGHVAHPRLGIVDHVAVHPLPGGNIANLVKAADIATQIARNASERCSLPVYLYEQVVCSFLWFARPLKSIAYGVVHISGMVRHIHSAKPFQTCVGVWDTFKEINAKIMDL